MNNRFEQKAVVRKGLMLARQQLDVTSRTEKNQAILARLKSVPEILSAKTVFCFISYGTEFDTHPLLDWCVQQNKVVTVPKLTGREEMIAVVFKGWADIIYGPSGIPAPAAMTAFSTDIDVCITPGAGFTTTGKRIGYGRGYYDKWFARQRSGLKIAPCYECQIVEQLPTDKYDIPVDMLVTEDRIIRV